MTIEELRLNCGLGEEVCDSFGWDRRSLEEEHRGIPWDELKKFEVCMPGATGRRFGLICPRGERWIERFLSLSGDRSYPWAHCPDRNLPTKGYPYQIKLAPETEIWR